MFYQVDVDSIPAFTRVSYGYAKRWVQKYAAINNYELVFVLASAVPDEEIFVMKRNGEKIRTVSIHEA